MELMFLGTGAGRPSKERNVTAIILNLLNECNAIWLFDCGEGTQHQVMRSGMTLNRLERIFITHLHGDHIFGLPGLLSSRALSASTTPLTIYGPPGIRQFVETSLAVSSSYLTYPLNIIEIEEGVVIEDPLFRVEAVALDHRITCFGYRIVEFDKPGALDAHRLWQDGVKAGPIFYYLKRGEVVRLNDGRMIDGKDYLGPPQMGKVVAIFGDTGPTPAALTLARDANVMVHEATLESTMAEKANEFGHSTTVQAAMVAKESGANRLIITHISSRYGKDECQRLLAECQQVFPNTQLAKDFAVFRI